MKFRDLGANGTGPQNVTPKHKQPKSIGLRRSCSCLLDSFYIQLHLVLADASLGNLPMMSQRRTSSSLLQTWPPRERTLNSYPLPPKPEKARGFESKSGQRSLRVSASRARHYMEYWTPRSYPILKQVSPSRYLA